MQIKVTDTILDYDGKPLRENEVKLTRELIEDFQKSLNENTTTPQSIIEGLVKEVNRDPLTYRVIINYSLNSVVNENGKPETLTATDKAKCYEITKKIFESQEPDLTDSQITFIIERVEKIYFAPIICGRIRDIFKR